MKKTLGSSLGISDARAEELSFQIVRPLLKEFLLGKISIADAAHAISNQDVTENEKIMLAMHFSINCQTHILRAVNPGIIIPEM
jgi:hypothetical protein